MEIAPKCKITLNLLSHIPWKSQKKKKNLIHILPLLLIPSQPGGARTETAVPVALGATAKHCCVHELRHHSALFVSQFSNPGLDPESAV